MPAIARVEPLTTARTLRGPFDYRLTAELADVAVGSLLLVPFGHREVAGVVVGLAERSDVSDARLLAPRRALEHGVPADLVELAEWMAGEYCSTVARALGLVMAPGATREAHALIRLVAELTAAGELALSDGQKLTESQRMALQALLDGPRAITAIGVSHAALRRLSERGLVRVERRPVRRRPEHRPLGTRRPEPPALTAAQSHVLAKIEQALATGSPESLLLHGVTGSGKTEVYLRAATSTLERGLGVIILVPEIGLTPQMVARFTERLGDTVAVLHSHLSAGERHDEWRRLREGQARVCVGPRSAVFAPMDQIGLIVVDEEHDASYKHEGDPRYDARTVAEERARRSSALLLCGSATPRPESFERLTRLRLDERVDGRALPGVEILDMRETSHALHATTVQALADVRRAGGKAIVLLNRRGWCNFLTCRSCGRVWMCPECDVALVLHRSESLVACHHCGHREPAPERCGDCGSLAVARHGSGTERLEHELTQALDHGSFPVFRLDADVTAVRDGAGAILRDFEAAPTGVLVGTQMVAKGHDFPDVSLAVILDADSSLRFPDFRSEERTFALVAQLAGRAGRGVDGRVLVQTIAPDARAIVLGAQHDSEGFLSGELQRRAALHYPPFSHLIRVVCSSAQAGGARQAAAAIHRRLDSRVGSVLGPAPLFRLRGRERSQLVIKANERGPAVTAVGKAVEQVASEGERGVVSYSVDVDPQ